MKQYTLYIGLNDKDTKQQKIDTIEAFKIVSAECTKKFGGATIYNAKGIYKHDNGDIVIENTLRVEILEFDSSIFSDVRELCAYLKRVLNQELIAVQVQDIQSELW